MTAPYPETARKEAIRLYKEVNSVSQVSRRTGVSRPTVAAWLKAAGIPRHHPPRRHHAPGGAATAKETPTPTTPATDDEVSDEGEDVQCPFCGTTVYETAVGKVPWRDIYLPPGTWGHCKVCGGGYPRGAWVRIDNVDRRLLELKGPTAL